MRPVPLRVIVPVALLVTALATGCADVREQLDEVTASAREGIADAGGTVRELADRTRFCLDLARAVTAIESGSPASAAEAAEGVLAQAPDDLREDARALVARLREAGDDPQALTDDLELREVAERIHQRTRDLCDPRAG